MKTIKKKYIEMPLHEFIKECPDIVNINPIFAVMAQDKRYIVRLYKNRMEVGFPSDDWEIHD